MAANQLIDIQKKLTITRDQTTTVRIKKSDISTASCLEGAKLTIKDKDQNIIDTWISSCENGEDNHYVSLELNDYIFIEETAPSGYATSESIEFTVNEDGLVDKVLDMRDAPLKLCLYKISKNSNSKEALEGAEFEIYKEDDKTSYRKFTTSSKLENNCISYLPVGTYIVKETKSPEGYKISNEEIKVEVKDTSDDQIYYIENEVIAPKTSKNNQNIIIILSIVLFIFGGIILTIYFRKKRKKKILSVD